MSPITPTPVNPRAPAWSGFVRKALSTESNTLGAPVGAGAEALGLNPSTAPGVDGAVGSNGTVLRWKFATGSAKPPVLSKNDDGINDSTGASNPKPENSLTPASPRTWHRVRRRHR